jgi:hypothetical protein
MLTDVVAGIQNGVIRIDNPEAVEVEQHGTPEAAAIEGQAHVPWGQGLLGLLQDMDLGRETIGPGIKIFLIPELPGRRRPRP